MPRTATIVIGATLLMGALPAIAADVPIKLDPMKGEAKPEVLVTRNVTGRCGAAIVRVMGMSDEYATASFDSDAGRVIVRSAKKELVLGEDSLNDYNAVDCVDTPQGKRLVVYGSCSGSACGGDITYYTIVDADQARLLAPMDPHEDTCDRACATRILGDAVPAD